MAETDLSQLVCTICDSQGLYADDDGYFYCLNCNSQAEDIVDVGNADEDFIDKGKKGTALYSVTNKRHIRQRPTFAADTQFGCDHIGPVEPADFGFAPKGVVYSAGDYYNAIRLRYVLGVQLMIQYQCEALVEKFGVTPLICGIAGSIWMQFVAFTKVFDDDWADKVTLDSEIGEKKYQKGKHVPNEPRNMYNERMVILWFKSLKRAIPLSHSLAISYLSCHVAREPILSTDITKWAIEGKLPYYGVFPKIAESIKEIEKYTKHVSVVCPLDARSMFRPSEHRLGKLESVAASIAHSVGLSLPPVNFYRIAYRYLKKLSLPVEKIIPYACRVQEWSMPPELWLSKDENVSTRVCVMSILIVTIRILYNLHGFGKWEDSLSIPMGSSSRDDPAASFDKSNKRNGDRATRRSLCKKVGACSSSLHEFESDGTELLRNLEKRYDELKDSFEYSKDLPTYLHYCKDVVFAGLEPLYKDPTLIEELWDFYEKNREDIETSGEYKSGAKRWRDDDKLFCTPSMDSMKHKDEKITTSSSTDSKFQLHNNSIRPNLGPGADSTEQSPQTCQVPATDDKGEASSQSYKDIALKHLKIDMEENFFSYIPPRVDIKRHDHLQYERRCIDGSLEYIAHADYYIVLRACAKVAQVDVRVMHLNVLRLENRLDWIEKWIDYSLMGKCDNGPANDDGDLDDDLDGNLDDEAVNLSNLNL